MATIAELERLEALVANLKGLAGKQRGELIEAETWNRLVSAVIDIGRATIEDRSDEVPRHSHSDQVALDWLDPKLKALVLEGGLGNPASAAQFDRLDRQFEKLGRSLQDLEDRLGRLQADLSSVATRDVEREASVGTALRKLDGVFDAREDVAGLRGSLRLLEGQVRTAAELSERLRDDTGNDLDFNALARRITTLEALGERLKLPDGNDFGGDAYARDLGQLRAELVTEAELREALEGIRNNFSADLRSDVLEAARAAALEANAGAIEGLGRDLRAEQQARIRSLEETLDTRIGAATGDLRESILADARGEQTGLLDRRLENFSADRDREMDRRFGSFAQELDGRFAGQAQRLQEDVTALVRADLGTALDDFSGRIGGIETSTTGLEAKLSEVSQALSGAAARIEAVNRDLLAADSRIAAQLSDRIGRIEVSLDEKIRNAADASRVAMREERAAELALMRDQLTTDLTRSLREVARTEVAISTTQLRGEMTEIADARIASGMAAIRAQVLETSAVSDARLAGLVSAEVRRATADLDARIASGIDSRSGLVTRDVTPILPSRGGTR
ncbi:hypothetical protein [Paracoccus ravus]|uniref:hypothetical protein n=1 Tax=Paracoccus ravus TaxID=2447760 RepID=UPI00106DF8D7|nr:hypothetical protein [Paracoccus ravus]